MSDTDSIDEIEGLLGLSEDNKSDLVLVLKDLLDLGSNIEAKTELDKNEIKQLLLLRFWSKEIAPYSPSAKVIADAWIDNYTKLKVSFKRKGRKEIIQALANRDKMSDENKEVLKRILH